MVSEVNESLLLDISEPSGLMLPHEMITHQAISPIITDTAPKQNPLAIPSDFAILFTI